MKWLLASIAIALAAVVAANALLLVYGGTRNDPVGRLSPIAKIRPGSQPPSPRVTDTPSHGGREDD